MSEAKVVSVGQTDLLSTRIKSTFDNCSTPPGSGDYNPSACIVKDAESGDENVKGYIRGPQASVNNYVQFAGTDWRIVKINNNGTILMVRDDVLKDGSTPITRAYDSSSNNFATSSIKTYLNNDFYNTLNSAQKGMLVSNNWDTSCTGGTTYGTCPDNGPTTTISKVGLLTHYDYAVGTKSIRSTGYNCYLNKTTFNGNNISYWLGTGRTVMATDPFYVSKTGVLIPGYITTSLSIRPAIVLKAGTLLDCTIGSGAGQCNGSSTNPYKIK